MANIKSAKKRVLVNKREKSENRLVKTSLNTEIKKFRKDLAEGLVVEAEKRLAKIEADIMSAKSKGAIHSNTASRKVARLKLALVKASAEVKPEAKVEEKKVETKAEKVEEKVEAPAKKTAAKKTTTKTTAAKKTTTKTTTAKKTTKKAE